MSCLIGKDKVMKIMSKLLLNCSVFAMLPVLANAAGTYYTGNYQSPQSRYSQQPYATARQNYSQQNQQRAGTQTYSQQGMSAYNRNQYAQAGYTPVNGNMQNMARQTQNNNMMPVNQQTNTGEGFRLGGGFSHQFANWKFNMKQAGSKLHYDNIEWNVFDVAAGYGFKAGNTALDIHAGFKYGMQASESTMIDDDISNGGFGITEWVSCTATDASGNCTSYQSLGDQIGHALSIGTSRDGSMMEFNAGIGLKDVFSIGKLKITPSVGWRYLKYELQTHDNHGLSVDTFTGTGGCVTIDGETQCDPVLVFYYINSDNEVVQSIVSRSDTNGDGVINTDDGIEVPSSSGVQYYVEPGGTYYYYQPGVSHKYEVEWSGPYVGLDMRYDVNQNNNVNAYVELGIPSYTATADQPYRYDWAHPKSVEDKAGIGDGLHLGLGANWSSALTDNVALSIGVTYDYYTVSDADATTYLNESYYTGIYNYLLNEYGGDEAKMLAENQIAVDIKNLESECPGWVCTTDGEIESFYKSLGVRVGLNARF